MNLDVVTIEIIRNRMIAATQEMSRTLVRTAFNPLLYEVQDYGISIISPTGDLWAETPACTIFSHTLPDVIKSGLRRHGIDGFAEGDVLIANDPFETGTHISDTTVYMPVFWDGKLVAFAANTAHWADIGGKNPGGWCPDTTDTYQEGLCFTHQRLLRQGEKNEDLWDFIRSNVRVPDMVEGDLEAQIACCRQGAERIRATCAKYGADNVVKAMDHVVAATARAMADAVAALPDGTYSARTRLDFDGVDPNSDCTVALTMRIEGSRIHCNFEGSSPSVRGPVNIPELSTRAAVRAVVKGLLMADDGTNEGHTHCLNFHIPPGLIVSPQRPAPTDSYGYLIEGVTELVFQCLAHAIPERCPAGGFQLFGVSLSRTDLRHGKPFVLIEPLDGGNGAQMSADGGTLMFIANGDVPNIPVEVMENRYPVRIERLDLEPSVAGVGAYRGGFGVRKDYRMLEPGIVMSFSTENTKMPIAKGVDGGSDGRPSSVIIAPDSDQEVVMTERASAIGPLPVGSIVRAISGGGGGRGNPFERSLDLVSRDVVNGFVSIDEARTLYGVVLRRDASGRVTIDEAQTAALRRTMAAA